MCTKNTKQSRSGIDTGYSNLTSKIITETYDISTASSGIVFSNMRTGVLSSGDVSVSVVGNQVTLCVNGLSAISGTDWIGTLNSEYLPSFAGGNKNYFSYKLDSTDYNCYILSTGYVYFENLATSGQISAVLTWNIAT